MFWIYKLLRGMFKAIASAAAPWQVAIGTFLGVLLGFLPIFPASQGPALLGLGVLALAIVINCHFGSVLLWMGFCAVLGKLLAGPAVMLGDASGLGQTAADIPILAASHLNHTGWLGRTLIGLAAAPLIAVGMYVFTMWFRAKLIARLNEAKRLRLAGKLAGNSLLVRTAFWFFDI